MSNKTHTEVKEPQISASRLADFMGASEQERRTIVRTCKFRSTARIVQQKESKEVIAASLQSGRPDQAGLHDRLEMLRNRMFEDGEDFQRKVNAINADCVERFILICESLDLPKATFHARQRFPRLTLRGTHVTFRPDLLVSRTNRANKQKIGALMLRYAKGKPLASNVATYQSAFMFGYLARRPFAEAAAPERELCITLDVYNGTSHLAPGNAGYLFKEMEAACESIAERWPAIRPPPGAIL